MNPHEALHPLQIVTWRRMNSAQKWALARSAQKMVIDATRRRLRREYPDISDDRLAREVARAILHGHS